MLPVPSLHPPASGGSWDESAARHVMSAGADVGAMPGLVRALGASADRPWQVGGLLWTLAAWYLSRSEKVRRLVAERESYVSDLRRLQHELGTLREASVGQASALKRSHAERDCYRREHDEPRAFCSAAPIVPLHAMRDLYKDRGYEHPRTSDVARPDGSAKRL